MDFSSTSSLGCLSAPLSSGCISCSIALLNPRNAISFRSTIAGQEKTQVGRWHAFRRKDERNEEDLTLLEGTVDWDRLWKSNSRRTRKDLPDELTRLDAEHASSILYFSDLSPEGLSSAISESFPGASQVSKLGIVTAVLELNSRAAWFVGFIYTFYHRQTSYFVPQPANS